MAPTERQPAFPNLAGQYEDYILKALTHYKNGKRKNPIMAAQVRTSPKDMLDLAAYFSPAEHRGEALK
jgi:cytochrome c553